MRTVPEFLQSVDDRIDRSGGPSSCHEWRGCKIAGYGAVKWQGRMLKVHRLTMERQRGLPIGSLPSSVFVCHRCDNPGCANPAHLFLGDCDTNLKDMASKGRGRNQHSWASGLCKRGHDITNPDNLRQYPDNYPTCLLCEKHRRQLRNSC